LVNEDFTQNIPYTYNLNTIVPLCMICKLMHVDD